MRNGLTLTHLFLLMALLVGLFAHGSAIAQQESALHSASHIADVIPHHHTQCDDCMPPGHDELCGLLGHCLIGIPVAAPALASIGRPSAVQVAVSPHMTHWTPGNPDPPPRLS